ncbi:aminoglycoside phosphotransferase family protein [Streptomyces sp. NBC_00178]|uniref:phosphotransferase n=1 Tax=Streptomyces sp. NBC_00178 TaxID=2975672 RepID=UPI002E2ADFAB|nr:phosphotransferase [Streptomyces sp. NBC_00178]
MTVDTPVDVRGVPAGRQGPGGDATVIEGPFRGHYRETYVFALPDGPLRCKVHEPRSELFRFDRRCFLSEDRLLLDLRGRVSRIPGILVLDEHVLLQWFIEGRTLGRGTAGALSARHAAQLGRLFGELVALDPASIGAPRLCAPADHPGDGDSAAFLESLIDFTEHEVHGRHAGRFGSLLRELGVRDGALDGVRSRARGLTDRPFTLVHGDLHRLNFVVDDAGDLWTIDWELSMVGDPLYDLATHLHLMRYSARETERTALLWAAAVGGVRPECAKGWREDLDVLLAYKRAQSVYTDVIRGAIALEQPGAGPAWSRLPVTAHRVREVLERAREPLGLDAVPSLREVMAAYTRWLRGREAAGITAAVT